MDRARLASLLGSDVTSVRPLGGGCIADVLAVDLADGRALVVKSGARGDGLDREGWMLGVLAAANLPVPRVHHADDTLLVMDRLEAGRAIGTAAQTHAADLIAALHGTTATAFGLDRDTLIGGLPQANPWTADWLDFLRDHRLLAMARQGLEAGRLSGATMDRVEHLCGRLGDWLPASETPALLHGDLWTGNILVGTNGRISGFVDPAVYYGAAEMDLAFSTLFGTFGEPFFTRYQEHRPLAPGFFEERRDLYNLYPLLVHVRLFGGAYGDSVDRTLARYGC